MFRQGPRQGLVEQHDGFNDGLLAAGQHLHRFPWSDAARRNGAGEAAKIRIRAIDPLHRQPKIGVYVRRGDLHGLQVAQQRGATVPIGAPRALNDIVTLQCGQRDTCYAREIELFSESQIVRFDLREYRRIIVDQIHLVYRQHHMRNTQQRRQKRVAASLSQHALGGVDQNHRDISCGGSGDHVSRVLLVARSIRNDKLAMIRAEKTVGHVDCNALFALGCKAVYQQRKINVATLGSQPFGFFEQRGNLIVENQLGFVKHTSNEGAFTVVNAAAGDEAQEVQRVLLR